MNELLATDVPSRKSASRFGRAQRQNIDLWDVLTALRRRVLLIGAVALLFLGTTVFTLSQVTPTYAAYTQILLGEQGLSDQNSFDLVEAQGLSNSVIEGEIAIMRSDEVLARVVKHLKLDADQEFNPLLREAQTPNFLVRFAYGIKNFLMPQRQTAQQSGPDSGLSDEVLEAASANERSIGEIGSVVNNVRRGLFIRQQGSSFILSVQFTSENPKKAAAISNVLMDEYIAFLVDKRFQAARRFTGWLEGRVEELAIKLEASEREALAFRATMDADADSSVRLEQQMREFTTKLVNARAELAEAQARASRAEEINQTAGALATANVLSNEAIIEFRKDLLTLRQEAVATTRNFYVESRQGESILRAISTVEAAIVAEVDNLLFELKSRVEIMSINVAALEQSLRSFEVINLARSNEQIRLNQLQRIADANRIVYEGFLGRYKETSEIQNLQSSDAKVLSYASPPVAPAYPRKRVAAVLALVGGLLIGSALALLLEMRSKRFNSTRQISEETGMSVFGSMQRFGRGVKANTYLRALSADPLSAAGRSAMALANNVSLHSGASFRSVFVTSHGASADKTLTSVGLAWAAVRSGKTCILLDGDIRTARLTIELRMTENAHFLPAVYGEMPLNEAVFKTSEGGFDFIGTQIISADPSVIYNTKNTQWIIAALAKIYDVVIVDGPSMETTADSSMMPEALDLGIFTIPAGKVGLRNIEKNLSIFREMELHDAGIVLTETK